MRERGRRRDARRAAGPPVHPPQSRNGRVDIRFAVPGATVPALEIYDLAGRLVRHLPGTGRGANLAEAAWDGRDDRGRPVPAGAYLVRAAAPGAAGAARVMMLR